MVLSAVEMYNRECVGYLFGYVRKRPATQYTISSAMQLAAVVRRTPFGVHQSKRAYARMTKFINTTGSLFPVIGDYHSHPRQKSSRILFGLSATDRCSLEVGNVAIVMAISPRERRLVQWELRDESTRLRGSLGRFNIHFTAHHLVSDGSGGFLKDADGVPVTERLVVEVAKTTLNALNRAAKK